MQKLRFYIAYTLLVGFYPNTAQHLSKLGRFSVDYPKACAPASISIYELDPFGAISRQYIYEPGQVETTDTFHVFENPGIYQIVQFLGEDIRPKSDTLIFEVTKNLPPKFEVLACSDNQFMISIEDNMYDYYIIWFSESDSIVFENGDPLPFRNATNGSGSVIVKGYYENAFPNCSESSLSFNLPKKEIFEIIDFKIEEICKDDVYISFSINPLDEFALYQIQIDNQNGHQFQIFGNSQKEYLIPLPYNQKPKELCLDIAQISVCDSATINSIRLCNSELQYESSNKLTYATYQNQKILIELDSNFIGSANVFKRNSYQDFQFLTNTDSSITDDMISLDRYYEYLLVENDTCGLVKDSISVSPPYINIVNRGYYNNQVTIDYREPINKLIEAKSELIFYNNDKQAVISQPISESFRLPAGLGANVSFFMKWTYEEGIEIYSNIENIEYNYIIHVPDAFTPNNDGINDKLELFGLPTQKFTFTIYDRWGSEIHKTDSNPVWDGRLKGGLALEGSYTYRISFETENGEHKSQVGSFTLLRK